MGVLHAGKLDLPAAGQVTPDADSAVEAPVSCQQLVGTVDQGTALLGLAAEDNGTKMSCDGEAEE